MFAKETGHLVNVQVTGVFAFGYVRSLKARDLSLSCAPCCSVNDAEFDWAAACIARDETHAHWLRHHVTMDEFRFREGLFAAVDCVHFMKVSRRKSFKNQAQLNANLRCHSATCTGLRCVFQDSTLLAIGSRDRYLNVVDTSRLDAHDANSSKSAHVLMMGDAHDVSTTNCACALFKTYL